MWDCSEGIKIFQLKFQEWQLYVHGLENWNNFVFWHQIKVFLDKSFFKSFFVIFLQSPPFKKHCPQRFPTQAFRELTTSLLIPAIVKCYPVCVIRLKWIPCWQGKKMIVLAAFPWHNVGSLMGGEWHFCDRQVEILTVLTINKEVQ